MAAVLRRYNLACDPGNAYARFTQPSARSNRAPTETINDVATAPGAFLVVLIWGTVLWLPNYPVLTAPRRILSWVPVGLAIGVSPNSIGLASWSASSCAPDDSDYGGFAILGATWVVAVALVIGEVTATIA